jgi:uncharacterized protein YndB with AHSA1/START domain
MGLKFRIKIDAKPDEVFGYLSDVARHGEWGNPAAKLSVTKTSDGALGAGSKFRSTQKFAGKEHNADIEIREFEPPRKLKIAAHQSHGGKKPATFVHTFTLTPDGAGTVVERDIDRENASPFAALGIIFYPAIKADAMKGLRGLKAKIESGAR